jgi:aarF domain-containing kinase
MRTAFATGRLCLRQACNGLRTRPLQSNPRLYSTSPPNTFLRNVFRFQRPPPPPYGAKLLLAGATLTPAAMVAISGDNGDETKTGEQKMLEASHEELINRVPKRLKNSKKIRRGIYFWVDTYIVEPVCTGLRFLHLVFIFVPVIVTIPVIWLGARRADRDNERSGTLWWYALLVKSLERAGAAFIKVLS